MNIPGLPGGKQTAVHGRVVNVPLNPDKHVELPLDC